MALTFPRWLLAACAACALTAAALLTGLLPVPQPFGGIYRGMTGWARAEDSLENERTTLQWSSRLAALRLRELQIRDSVLSATRAESVSGLVVRIDPALPDSVRALVGDAIAAQWKQLGGRARVPVLAAAVLDTGTQIRGVSITAGNTIVQFAAFTPAELGKNLCLSIIQVRLPGLMGNVAEPHGLHHRFVDPQALADRALGPCAYIAAFGTPGQAVSRWLTRNSLLGQDAHWSEPTGPFVDVRETRPFQGGWGGLGDEDYSVPRLHLSDDGVGCSAGNSMQCERVVLEPSIPFDSAARLDQVASISWASISEWQGTLPVRLGPKETGLLSDMVHDLGPTRFAAFWASPDSVAGAFRSAAHASLGDWTRDWVQRVYGTASVGPFVPASSAVTGILLALAAVGVALGIGTRRQVG